jgi:AraC-like DNA-binding protein
MKLTMRELVALAGCRLERPMEWSGALERVDAAAAVRSFPMRVTPGLGICIKRGGSAHDVSADGRMLRYPADAICIRPPGCILGVTRTDASFLSIDCDPELLPEGAAFAMPGLPGLIMQLTRSRTALGRTEALASVFESLRIIGLMRSDDSYEQRAAPVAARARDYLEAHVADDVTLDVLASEARANKFVLVRAFRRRFGMTPHAYLVARRVQLARDLIARRVPLAIAASNVGFADQSHLGRHFKRIVGMTPGEYAWRS